MSYTITLGQIPLEAMAKAADFVRQKYNMDKLLIICEKFETEFNVKLHSSDYIFNFKDDIEFRSEADYLMFLLRWS